MLRNIFVELVLPIESKSNLKPIYAAKNSLLLLREASHAKGPGGGSTYPLGPGVISVAMQPRAHKYIK